MANPKITIDQLKNYLGTGLRLEVDESATKEPIFLGLYNEPWDRLLVYFGSGSAVDLRMIDEVKPICYRLSDLDKFIPELGFVPIEQIDGYHNFSTLRTDQLMIDPTRYPFTVLQALFQWHFWPFDQSAFDQGLVIDKLTHRKEVSNG